MATYNEIEQQNREIRDLLNRAANALIIHEVRGPRVEALLLEVDEVLNPPAEIIILTSATAMCRGRCTHALKDHTVKVVGPDRDLACSKVDCSCMKFVA